MVSSAHASSLKFRLHTQLREFFAVLRLFCACFRILVSDNRVEILRLSDVELVFLKKAVGLSWWLDLADPDPAEFTSLYSMLGELEG
jgi:hypothetical protein